MRWFFFDRVPVKDDVWILLVLFVVFPVFEWFYAPIAETRAIRAKRAIRIEAKLDYLLSKNLME